MTRKLIPLMMGLIAWIPLSSFTPSTAPQTILYAPNATQHLTSQDTKLTLRTDTSCPNAQQTLTSASTELEALRNVYAQTLGYRHAAEVELKGYYFCSEAAYQAYKRKLGVPSTSRTGFFSLPHQEIVVMEHQPSQGRQTLMHEASHALLRSRQAPYSKWLNEGLAEYFEGATWQERQGFQVHPQKIKNDRIKSMLARQELPALKQYLSLSNAAWQKQQSPTPVSSTIAWSLVYYFMEDSARHPVLRQVIQDQQKGLSSVQSLSQHYPGGIEKLEKDWHQFIQAQRRVHNWQGFA